MISNKTLTFHQLSTDNLSMIFNYLGYKNLASWFAAAVTDRMFLRIAYLASFIPPEYIGEYLSYGMDQINNWEILNAAYPDFRSKIKEALEKFIPINTRISQAVKKASDLRAGNACNEEGVELCSVVRRI